MIPSEFSRIHCVAKQGLFCSKHSKPKCNWNWGPAASHSKAIKEARLVKSEVCFVLDAGSGEGWGAADAYLKPNSSHPPLTGALTPLTPDSQKTGLSQTEGGGYMERQQSALTVILKLVIGGLAKVILIVLGTVNLHFQWWLFSFLWGQFSELW